MALFMAARTIGKHTAEAFESRRSTKIAEAHAVQQDPNVAKAIAESRARQTKTRATAAILAGTLAAGAGYVFWGKVDSDIAKLWNTLKSVPPTPKTAINVQASINKLDLPAKLIVVEGQGRSTVNIHSRLETDTPVVGAIWNNTGAHFTDKTASVTRAGKDQLTLPLKALEFGRVKEADGWHAQVRLDGGRVGSQIANMDYAYDAQGKRMESNGQDLAVRVFSSNSELASATQVADWGFANKCGSIMLNALVPAVQQNAGIMLQAAAGLERSEGHANIARSFDKLARKPIEVSVYHYVDTLHGGLREEALSPTAINLPQHILPVSKDVTMASGCTATAEVVHTLHDLQVQAQG